MTWIIAILARLGVTGRGAKAVVNIGIALLVAALLGGLWAYLSARENADDLNNQTIGRDLQNAENTAHTLDQLEKADAAEEVLDRDAAARLANCRLHSRTPENCRP